MAGLDPAIVARSVAVPDLIREAISRKVRTDREIAPPCIREGRNDTVAVKGELNG
jgi:hypothetical protein